ncbi:hypothetical protein BDF22DRAFT_323958 [Syncephalis plumigaleata]|nr:hypothetical protein BDF22DRAFT_323958 [Syncephalis plumigaleata]
MSEYYHTNTIVLLNTYTPNNYSNGLAIKEENDDDNDSEAETALLSHVHYAPLKIIAAAIEASVNTSEVTSTSVSTGVKREEQPLLHNDVATSLDMNDDTKVKSDEDIVSEKSEDSDEDTKYTIATPTTIKKEESDDDDDSRYSMTTSSTTRKINATNYLDKIKVEKKESDIMDNKSDSDSDSDNEDNHETTLTTNISTPTTNEDNITESSDYASMTVALPPMNEATSLLQVTHLVQTQVDSNESEDMEQNSNFDHLNDKAFSVSIRK